MNDYLANILTNQRFSSLVKKTARQAVRADLNLSDSSDALSFSDINFGLLSASALTAVAEERAQIAVLRVTQAVLANLSSTQEQVAAATLLLDRVGNGLTSTLAAARYGTQLPSLSAMPLGLATDAARRMQELSIIMADGSSMPVNPFQAEFWRAVGTADWVSVSAPTSAGKSFIVREWIRQLVLAGETSRLVYLAPTRALVEEIGAYFRTELNGQAWVHTLPWDPQIEENGPHIFVLTQERLHVLQERSPGFAAQVLFVDEAQKISEGSRGVLLSQVLDEAALREPSIRFVFASPLSQNPEVLFGERGETHSTVTINAQSVTVTQNLVYVRQKYRTPGTYSFELFLDGETIDLGQVDLIKRPNRTGEKVPFIAATVGSSHTGNLVYANGAAEAEKYARLIYEALGPTADEFSPEVEELVEFSKGTVHDRYALATYVTRGVAFHYGDMPMVLKAKVEERFRDGTIRFLVCTSTLLEGVNLPCKNIFMRGPKKGQPHMSMADFWNLAGRAGRWGKEFQGNIFCIDAHDDKAWPVRPATRQRTSIIPAAGAALEDTALIAYVRNGAQIPANPSEIPYESVFSWLTGRYLERASLSNLSTASLEPGSRDELASLISSSVSHLTVPTRLIKRHAGISPLSIQRLYDSILEHGRPEHLALIPPTADGASTEYNLALERIAATLGGSFSSPRRRLQLAGLIVNWMSGRPVSMIIENRARYRRQNSIEFNYPQLIRATLEDIEDIARFEAPKFLSCYSDVVAAAAADLGRDIGEQLEDIEMMLELGVPRRTDMSFIALGLSRATCFEIAPYVQQNTLSPSECTEWLVKQDLEAIEVRSFAARELRAVKQALLAREWK